MGSGRRGWRKPTEVEAQSTKRAALRGGKRERANLEGDGGGNRRRRGGFTTKGCEAGRKEEEVAKEERASCVREEF